MTEYPADPNCELCGGSGIDPDSKMIYHDGAPHIGDPFSLEPCDCIVRQWPNNDKITGYPDHYIVNGDHSGCMACVEKGLIPPPWWLHGG